MNAVVDPRVSVAMCTHNGARFVEQQLASILNQTRLPDEVIVSDDASSDDTVARVRRVLASARGRVPELVVLENADPLGVTANFEQAVAAATGDLIALCDQDDIWHPERIANALAIMAGPDAPMAIGSDARLVDADGRPIGRSLFDDLEIDDRLLLELRRDPFATLLRRNLFTGATMMIRRELVDAARPFPAEWVHDEWLAVIAAATSRVGLERAAVIDYRQHGSNVIGVARPTIAHKVARVFEPRGDRNARLLARSEVLVDRLVSTGADARLRDSAIGKLRFERFRIALPRTRVLRVVPILGALARREYSRFASQRDLDAVRDLLQRG